MVTDANPKTPYSCQNRNRGQRTETEVLCSHVSSFKPRQFQTGRLENAAYTQWVAHSIQTNSYTPTCVLRQF